MKIFSLFKYLVLGKKALAAPPRIVETPIENIVFPDTYKEITMFNDIPVKSESCMSGRQFGQSILNIPATQQRDDLIYEQCVRGNLPNWMRQFKAITVEEKSNTLTYFVSPDVLCIGDEDDFLRVSLNGYTARKVVDLFGCMLPTKKISDQIWKAANLKMMPTGMGASFHMGSTQTMMDHNYGVIEKQRADRNFNIIAGHKKDIIVHSELLTYKGNICIYGFHLPSGKPLQGAQYEAHNVWYQDYSHSIRLVSRKAILNGQSVDLVDILKNKQYSYLISDDGTYDARLIYKH